MTRIIITGGSGFIASHIIELMLQAKNKYDILVIDNFSSGKIDNIAPYLVRSDIHLQEGDITNLPFLLNTFNKYRPKHVIHLAAQAAITTAWKNPVKDLTENGIGTLNVIQASKNVGVEKIIFSSTSAVYRETKAKLKEKSLTLPGNPYGISKLAAEHYLLSMFPSATILRFGNVYGERQVPIGENQLIPRIIRHFKYGDEFYIHGDGKQERDFVYAGDVAQAVVTALYNKQGIFNISSGNCFSVNEIAGILEDIYDIRGYRWEHSKNEDPRRRAVMDISKAKSELSWKPTVNIREGIKKVVDWWELQ